MREAGRSGAARSPVEGRAGARRVRSDVRAPAGRGRCACASRRRRAAWRGRFFLLLLLLGRRRGARTAGGGACWRRRRGRARARRRSGGIVGIVCAAARGSGAPAARPAATPPRPPPLPPPPPLPRFPCRVPAPEPIFPRSSVTRRRRRRGPGRPAGPGETAARPPPPPPWKHWDPVRDAGGAGVGRGPAGPCERGDEEKEAEAAARCRSDGGCAGAAGPGSRCRPLGRGERRERCERKGSAWNGPPSPREVCGAELSVGRGASLGVGGCEAEVGRAGCCVGPQPLAERWCCSAWGVFPLVFLY